MEKKIIDPTKINGWGIDADPKDQPNYPIKKYTGDDHNRKNWQRPSLQPTDVEILKSTERPYLSAVFGSNYPPKGLSGNLRRIAFKYSENMIRHWVTLLMADRVDVIESRFDDVLHAHVPNAAKELGWGAIGKHAPAVLTKKIVVRVLVLGAIAALVAYKVKQMRDHETE